MNSQLLHLNVLRERKDKILDNQKQQLKIRL